MIDRINKLKNIIRQSQADVFFITDPVNVRYMSGFTGGEAQLLISRTESVLITDFRYLEQAAHETKGLYEIRKREAGVSVYNLVKDILAKMNARSVAVEEGHISHKDYKDLKNTIGDIHLTAQNCDVENLRQIKYIDELSLIRKAAAIGKEAFEYIKGIIEPGMTENFVKNELEYKVKQLGASDMSFETIVASGKRSAMPHGTASGKIIEDGDIITIDFGCVYNGYCSDMTRTFFVGKKQPDTELLKIYDIVDSAYKIAVSKACAGISAKDLDAEARDYIKEKGYGEYFGHALGHGVGLAVHESPSINMKNNKSLSVGEVITIEPGIYIEGLGGVRIEDMAIIKENGCEII